MEKEENRYFSRQLGGGEVRETSLGYLSMLSSVSAIEIDSYKLNNGRGFQSFEELSRILEKHQIKDTDNATTISLFPYDPLKKAMGGQIKGEAKNYSELALEMKLLRSELDSFLENPGDRKELVPFLIDFSRELRNESYQEEHRMLVA